jgi:glycosyltransferase involved in cell wall biosynthesis
MVQGIAPVIRVAFVLEAHNWLGGISYYRNLLSALALVSPKRIQPVVFLGTDVPDEIAANYSDAEIVRTTLLNPDRPYGLVRRVIRKLAGQHDVLLTELLIRHSIQVLSHYSGRILRTSRIKTISWIPDFQHIHLPAFFPASQREMRQSTFADLIERSDLVVVSSDVARQDVAQFFPMALSKSAALRFVPRVDSFPKPLPIADLKAKYGFDTGYFFLPNQFWVHKNHQVVIEALRHLRGQGIPVTVLATGDTADYRQPEYFAELLARVKQFDLNDAFRPLGVVPFHDLLSLMHYSLAVINPSLYEGWSTSVEEAKAMGKTVILSNIPVHKEQSPASAMFFAPNDPLELSRHMRAVLTAAPAPSLDHWGERFHFSESYPRDRLKFATDFQEIVLQVLQ